MADTSTVLRPGEALEHLPPFRNHAPAKCSADALHRLRSVSRSYVERRANRESFDMHMALLRERCRIPEPGAGVAVEMPLLHAPGLPKVGVLAFLFVAIVLFFVAIVLFLVVPALLGNVPAP